MPPIPLIFPFPIRCLSRCSRTSGRAAGCWFRSGKANRAKQGLVLALEEGGEQENLKPLKTLLDYQPLLDSEQLWLLELLHRAHLLHLL